MKIWLTAIAALLTGWACFGLAVRAWLASEEERCRRFGDLWAECIAPQGQVALLLAVIFVVATGLLAWFAIRHTRNSNGP